LILSSEDRKQILNRAVSLAVKMSLPVWTTIILLSRRHGTKGWRKNRLALRGNDLSGSRRAMDDPA